MITQALTGRCSGADAVSGVLALLLLLLAPGARATAAESATRETKWYPGHYVLLAYNQGREQWAVIADKPYFAGGQRVYLWKDLEPRKGEYDFSRVEADLGYLRAHGKRLVIEVWDNFFSGRGASVPPDLLTDPAYGGGVLYRSKPGAQRGTGTVSKRYLPSVTDRFLKLVQALGDRFDADPNLAAFVFTETAIPVDGEGAADFSGAAYDEQMRRWVAAGTRAFPTTPVILYGNWYPYRGLDGLKSLGRYAAAHAVGWGGPDITPGHEVWGYQVIRQAAGQIPLGVAVQWQSYDGRWTARQLCDFALNDLKLNFVFWLDCDRRRTGGISFGEDVIPAVARLQGKTITDRPACFSGPKSNR